MQLHFRDLTCSMQGYEIFRMGIFHHGTHTISLYCSSHVCNMMHCPVGDSRGCRLGPDTWISFPLDSRACRKTFSPTASHKSRKKDLNLARKVHVWKRKVCFFCFFCFVSSSTVVRRHFSSPPIRSTSGLQMRRWKTIAILKPIFDDDTDTAVKR